MYFAHLNAQVYVYCNKITIMYSIIFKYICCCSVARSCLTLCDPVDCSMTGFPVLHYLPEFDKFMSIESMMLCSHLILCRPLLLMPSIFPSSRVFPNESALCIRWPKDWSFSFSISQPRPGLCSTRLHSLSFTRQLLQVSCSVTWWGGTLPSQLLQACHRVHLS